MREAAIAPAPGKRRKYTRAPSSVLIIRLSAIGDVVMASPLIAAFRRGYPEARLAWLVQPESADLLRHHPDLDEVIVWPRGRWSRLRTERDYRTLLREARGLLRELRSRRFDLALDVQGLLKSGLWARLSGARTRVGLGSKEGSRFLMTECVSKPENDPRIGSEYLHVARFLGLPVDEFTMHVAVADDDARVATGLLERHGIAGHYAAIAPFTTRPQKHWLEDRWPRLASRIRNELDLDVVLLGGPGDRAAAARLVDAGAPLVDLAGATTVGQAAALVRGASLLVGVDTGLTHMGPAFDVPTIALFGSTCPYLDAARPKSLVIYKRLDCSPCRRNPTCDGAYTCMREIEVEEVVRAARSFLS